MRAASVSGVTCWSPNRDEGRPLGSRCLPVLGPFAKDTNCKIQSTALAGSAVAGFGEPQRSSARFDLAKGLRKSLNETARVVGVATCIVLLFTLENIITFGDGAYMLELARNVWSLGCPAMRL